MNIHIAQQPVEMAQQAAAMAADCLKQTIDQKGAAHLIVATGASQLGMLEQLAQAKGIAWQQVTGFHLDEYIGLPITHPASFRLYLWQRFLCRLPVPLKAFHYLNGESDAAGECERVGRILKDHPIDLALVGIGENAHLAFNDPPADFQTRQPYLCVALDEACRRQQTGEGWFASLEEVPTHAISMSVSQIMASDKIVCTVPDQRKARAVALSLQGPVTPQVPASILQRHPNTDVFLDASAASLLES